MSADLVMLAKSTELEKSALDMNQHYLELQMFLQELECHPEIIMDRKYGVFKSENRLYGDNKKFNHRLHLSLDAMRQLPLYHEVHILSFVLFSDSDVSSIGLQLLLYDLRWKRDQRDVI